MCVCIYIGAWQGRGKRTGGLGAFLLAAHNAETGDFETVCKLGTGFSDEQLESFTAMLMPFKVNRLDSSLKLPVYAPLSY